MIDHKWKGSLGLISQKIEENEITWEYALALVTAFPSNAVNTSKSYDS